MIELWVGVKVQEERLCSFVCVTTQSGRRLTFTCWNSERVSVSELYQRRAIALLSSHHSHTTSLQPLTTSHLPLDASEQSSRLAQQIFRLSPVYLHLAHILRALKL
jgi:hypothetical protein